MQMGVMDASREVTLSPPLALGTGYAFLVGGSVVLALMGFFNQNAFLHTGPPVQVMGQQVDDWWTFSVLLVFMSVHQWINGWISDVVYPYLVNEVQNVHCKEERYGRVASNAISTAFNVYSNLDLLFIVNASTAQWTFFVGIVLCNTLVKVWVVERYYQRRHALQVESLV
jgi:hypothetical protein